MAKRSTERRVIINIIIINSLFQEQAHI